MDDAATRIQASFRGHLVRRDLVDAVQRDFEEVARRVEAEALREVSANAPAAASSLATSKASSRPRRTPSLVLARRAAAATDRTPASVAAPGGAPRDERPRAGVDRTRQLQTLRMELEWARDALERRRQHLRRMRRGAAADGWDEGAFEGGRILS